MQADWKIVERGWHAHVLGEAPHKFTSALEAVKTLRVRGTGISNTSKTLPHALGVTGTCLLESLVVCMLPSKEMVLHYRHTCRGFLRWLFDVIGLAGRRWQGSHRPVAAAVCDHWRERQGSGHHRGKPCTYSS